MAPPPRTKLKCDAEKMTLDFILRVNDLQFANDVRQDPTVGWSILETLPETPDYILVTLHFIPDLGRDPEKIPEYIRLAARIRKDGSDMDDGILPFAPREEKTPKKSAWERIRDGWLV